MALPAAPLAEPSSEARLEPAAEAFESVLDAQAFADDPADQHAEKRDEMFLVCVAIVMPRTMVIRPRPLKIVWRVFSGSRLPNRTPASRR